MTGLVASKLDSGTKEVDDKSNCVWNLQQVLGDFDASRIKQECQATAGCKDRLEYLSDHRNWLLQVLGPGTEEAEEGRRYSFFSINNNKQGSNNTTEEE
jgi:hypothetical protein